jgi:RNA polymerase sigma-70 factor (ECF subfamily)
MSDETTDSRRDTDTSLTLMMRVQRDPTDGEAWREFVATYEPMMRSWCARWGAQASDAEDVVQEVLLKLLSAMKKFQYDPARSFRGWLKTVTHNAWNDFVRSGRRTPANHARLVELVADPGDALADLERRLEEAFDREVFALAMRRVEVRVKETTWQAFRITALEGRSGAEAARELQVPIAHVFISKHRVQKMIEKEVRAVRGG